MVASEHLKPGWFVHNPTENISQLCTTPLLIVEKFPFLPNHRHVSFTFELDSKGAARLGGNLIKIVFLYFYNILKGILCLLAAQ